MTAGTKEKLCIPEDTEKEKLGLPGPISALAFSLRGIERLCDKIYLFL